MAKRCFVCGKIIKSGEPTHSEKYTQEEIYPVKGIMRFPKLFITHSECWEKELKRREEEDIRNKAEHEALMAKLQKIHDEMVREGKYEDLKT